MIEPDRCTWQEPAPGGEWHLWKAVLSLSLFDLSNKARRDDALAWLMSDEAHIGSAPWICTELSLDLGAVRQRALKIYDGQAALTWGKTRRTWQRRTNRDEAYYRQEAHQA